MTRLHVTVCVAGVLALCGCRRSEPVARTQPPSALSAPGAPAPVARGVRDCGTEKSAHGRGVNLPGRECFWEAYREGRPAQLSITVHTIEGDPLRYDLTVKSKAAIDVRYESHDRFGAPGKTRFVCRDLHANKTEGRVTLTLRDCDGASIEIAIP
jgi:hypothetical protein